MRAESAFALSAFQRWLVIGLIALTVFIPVLMYALNTARAPEADAPPFRELLRLEQLVLTAAVYPIKMTYMLLALIAVGLLWKQATPGFAALRWSMVFFLIGELICWVNIVAFFEENLLLEYLHNWGMVVCFSFLAFAVLEALDSGVFHYSAPNAKCALAGVCHRCAKSAAGPCALERLCKLTLPLVMLVGLMPFTASTTPVSYNTVILGVARNLSHSAAMQWYEIRYAPLAGLILMGAAWFIMLRRGRLVSALRLTKILLTAGLGHIGFAFMRLAFFAFYRDNLVWFVFWEEFTELILTAGVLAAVWLFCLAPRHNRLA